MIYIKWKVHQAADRNTCAYHTLLDDPVPHTHTHKNITLKCTYCFKIRIYIFFVQYIFLWIRSSNSGWSAQIIFMW